MNPSFSRWGAVALGICLSLLLGCSSKGGAVGGEAAEPVSAGYAPTQGKTSGRLLVWTADFSVEVADLGKASEQLTACMVALGGYVEEKSDYGRQSQSFVYRVPKGAFNDALGDVERSGTVQRRHVKGEDVTEQYVDVETRLKNDLALRDRFRDLLAKAKDVKDILLIETELNRIQSEIDSMEARMRVLKDQVQMSTIRVSLHQQEPPKPATIYGPLGYLYKGAEWFVVKLFVIRE
ncbi:DUF4349 domain-containing protein [Pseudomonas sp. Gutcm_11s]|uniref:DUF4349 domain-containing protein n=1 Tax=Pseudomonas sp. Gutcm_11s TaxID=3026088 RepID=UPI00235E0BC1|nr:DUF4349 domain-containing protein [Pseudomonas sp. Gutcm_11s]MDD0842757.1 DUF4349 domain-containing protein [Pseudomonas sp. Gutcm_11s]